MIRFTLALLLSLSCTLLVAQVRVNKRKHLKGYQIELSKQKHLEKKEAATTPVMEVSKLPVEVPIIVNKLAYSPLLVFSDSAEPVILTAHLDSSPFASERATGVLLRKIQKNEIVKKAAVPVLKKVMHKLEKRATNEGTGNTGAATAGFVMGLLAILFSFLVVPIFLCIPGLILSAIGRNSSRRGLAGWGIFLNLFVIIVGILVLIAASQIQYSSFDIGTF